MRQDSFSFLVSRFSNGRLRALSFARRGEAVCAVAALCLCLVSGAAVGQVMSGTTAQGMPTVAPTTDDMQVYTLTGSVVNSMTGEPIVRALVQIMGQNNPRAAFTDREGNFRFAGLHAMPNANLMAVKPGFYGNDSGQRVPMAMQRVTIGPDMAPLVVKLVPQSGISGTITDDQGEPLDNVRVGVVESVMQNGRLRQQRGQTVQTDEQGEYRLSNLPPGQYFVSAGPVWASIAEPDAGHAQMFFPGVPESSQATPVTDPLLGIQEVR